MVKRFGPQELLAHVLHKNLCSSCGACQELCPYFRSYKGRTAMLFPCTQSAGRCFDYCPRVEVDLDDLSQHFFAKPYGADPLGHFLSIRIARAGKRAGSASFQSGGTVSALMQFALEQKMIDGAILTGGNGIGATPRIVTAPEEVLHCASSKYAATPTLAALHRAVQQGLHQLGVVATPCQSLAVAQMRRNPHGDGNFRDPVALSIGLFCTWALDFRAFAAYLESRLDVGSIRKIDIPPPPAEVMEIFTEEGKTRLPLGEIRELVPETCSYCIDMTSEFADIGVGVVEGRPDWNTLIVRTPKGKELVEEAQKSGWLTVEDLPAENLTHLRWAAGNKKRRALLRGKEKGLVNTPEGGGMAMVRINPVVINEITA